ncbi:MAG: tetratricopeptide repeat protein [bacterium]|nr:tetratricopeptide repeat protein [bacterium]
MTQADFETRINTMDLSLFDAVLSGTGEEDRRALLGLQKVVRDLWSDYTYLEIGSHLGGSLQTYLMDPRCLQIYSIDKRPDAQPDERGMSFPYPHNSTDRMLTLLRDVAPDQMDKIVCFDADASEIDPGEIQDAPKLCFVDGEHTNRAVVSDFEFCVQVCDPNALIVFHDANIVAGGIQTILDTLQKQGIRHTAAHIGGVVFAIGLGDIELVDKGVMEQAAPMSKEEACGATWVLEPDPISLAAQMREVMDNPEQARRKGQEGRAYVHEHLTWASAAEKVQDRLRGLQGKPIRREISIDSPTSLMGPGAKDSSGPEVVDKRLSVFLLPSGNIPAAEATSALERFTDVSVQQVDVQAGFAAAFHVFLGSISSPYVALVRDDVIVTDGWFERLVSHLETDSKVAMVGPCLPVGSKGQQVKARYKSKKKELQKFARKFAGQDGTVDVQEVSSACVVIRSDVLEALGGFEAGFQTRAFLDDFARRIRQAGLKVACARDVFVHCEDLAVLEGEAREKRAIERLETGDGHRAGGEAEAAIACYREALEAKEDYLEATLILSAVLLEEDRGSEAVDAFALLVARYPDSSRLQNYLGRCLYQAGETDRGKACLEKAIALDPNFAEAYSNLGVLLWETGELDGALKQMNRAAELAPDNPDVVYNIGMIYAQFGQAKEAATVLERYLTISPDDLHAKVYLAVLMLENEREGEGIAQLEQVLEIDPDHSEALQVVADLQAAVEGASPEEGM